MSFITKLGKFMLGNGDAIAKPVDAVGEAFDKIFTSDEERLAAQTVLEKLRQQPLEWQAALNKIEAQSSSFFKSGWRPCLGWILDVSLAIYYIPQFVLATILWVKFCLTSGQIAPYPIGDISGLMELVFGMLGLATLRTVEKFGRVSK